MTINHWTVNTRSYETRVNGSSAEELWEALDEIGSKGTALDEVTWYVDGDEVVLVVQGFTSATLREATK